MNLTSCHYKLEVMSIYSLDLSPQNETEAAARASIASWFNLHNAMTDQRLAMKLTQHQVAEKLEISQPAVSAFENNNSLDTQLRTFINYAAALGLKINFSVERVSWKETD